MTRAKQNVLRAARNAVARRPHILVIEDDTDGREALSGLLENDGYRVTAMATARQALEYLQKAPGPDVILLDLLMPDFDGWDFRVVQKRDARLAKIPLVALSGAGRMPDAEMSLRKPIPTEELLRAIEEVLARPTRFAG